MIMTAYNSVKVGFFWISMMTTFLCQKLWRVFRDIYFGKTDKVFPWGVIENRLYQWAWRALKTLLVRLILILWLSWKRNGYANVICRWWSRVRRISLKKRSFWKMKKRFLFLKRHHCVILRVMLSGWLVLLLILPNKKSLKHHYVMPCKRLKLRVRQRTNLLLIWVMIYALHYRVFKH